ncbi:MAG: 3'(2'),5'-bisphosphate nucleotidase CysQ [Acidobacteria bacterium]|nr:3'(2'),5'-bisphosphate nucleotidase CysQ [Acidobacteriota bacterium]
MPTTDDHRIAREVAVAASELLLALREEGKGMWPDQLRAEGDRQSHELIMELLTEARPDDGILSEEGYDDGRRLSVERVWVVDPLDGTREYGEAGRPDWAVHIALAEGGLVTAGAVTLPAMGMVFDTGEPPEMPEVEGRPARVVTSRFHHPMVTEFIADALGAEMVGMGSAGAKAMAVVTGMVDAYAHAGGMYEWDSAAPVAVAQAAGFHASRLDGNPLVYNRSDPWLPDLLICRPELASTCLEAIEESGWRQHAHLQWGPWRG